MLYEHIGIASMRQFPCVPTTYVTENKENHLEIYTYQVSCPLSLRLLARGLSYVQIDNHGIIILYQCRP